MKKILSILLAAMLAFSALGATSMMAFAASNTVASPEPPETMTRSAR